MNSTNGNSDKNLPVITGRSADGNTKLALWFGKSDSQKAPDLTGHITIAGQKKSFSVWLKSGGTTGGGKAFGPFLTGSIQEKQGEVYVEVGEATANVHNDGVYNDKVVFNIELKDAEPIVLGAFVNSDNEDFRADLGFTGPKKARPAKAEQPDSQPAEAPTPAPAANDARAPAPAKKKYA